MCVIIHVCLCVWVSLKECFELYHATSGRVIGQKREKEKVRDCYRGHRSLDLIALMSRNWYDEIDSHYCPFYTHTHTHFCVEKNHVL